MLVGPDPVEGDSPAVGYRRRGWLMSVVVVGLSWNIEHCGPKKIKIKINGRTK